MKNVINNNNVEYLPCDPHRSSLLSDTLDSEIFKFLFIKIYKYQINRLRT